MLTLKGVGKDYNLRPVLEQVDLALEPGLVYCLTAPNGSGKSTLLHIMAGLTKPTSGSIRWGNEKFSAAHRAKVGVVLQQPMLYADLTALENLRLFGTLYRVKGVQEQVDMWLGKVGLADTESLRVREFSKGMKQRLSFARAMLHSPEVLLLDEPYDGLDVASRDLVSTELEQARSRGVSIFLVTHMPEETIVPQRELTIRFGRVVEI